MRDIKTRNTVKDIKVLNKPANIAVRTKNAVVQIKERAEETQNPHHATPNDYATGNIQNTAKRLAEKTAHHFSNPLQKARRNISRSKKHFQTAKNSIKTTQQAVKTTQKTAQAAAKSAKAAEKATRAAAKTTEKTIKTAVKVIVKIAKATIAAIRGTATLIAAGGWIAVAIILIICMIALIVGSVFGIFFSGEDNPDTGMTLKNVIAEINMEFENEIDGIISSNVHDVLEISEVQMEWKQVLAVYAVKTAKNPDNPMAVYTMDNDKVAILREVFDNMHTIDYWIESVEHTNTYTDENGDDVVESWYENILFIAVTHKSPEEMAAQYGFSNEQREWLAELFRLAHDGFWNILI